MSKLMNKIPFGEAISSNMKKGDLVSWLSWKIKNKILVEKINYGTIIEKQTNIYGGRPVIMILVLCSNTGNVINLNPFQLRLEETI